MCSRFKLHNQECITACVFHSGGNIKGLKGREGGRRGGRGQTEKEREWEGEGRRRRKANKQCMKKVKERYKEGREGEGGKKVREKGVNSI